MESGNYTTLATLTFRIPVTVAAARAHVRAWLGRVSRSFGGRRWYRHRPPDLEWVYVLETTLAGHWHAHVLLKARCRDVSQKDCRWMEGVWRRHGIAQVAAIGNLAAASRYLSKHIAPGWEPEINGMTTR